MGRHVAPATVREWTGLLHHLRLPPGVHHTGLAIATYADSDGTRVYPGVDRLATVMGVSRRTVMGHLGMLRDDLGLLLKVRGGRRRGKADEYHLVIPDDIPEHLLRSPAELDLEIERMRGAGRKEYVGRHKEVSVRAVERHVQPSLPVDEAVSGPVDNPPVRVVQQHVPEGAPQPSTCRSATHTGFGTCCLTTPVRVVQRHPTYQDLVTTTTDHTPKDLDAAVTAPRASPAQDPIFLSYDQDHDRPRSNDPPADNTDTVVIPFRRRTG